MKKDNEFSGFYNQIHYHDTSSNNNPSRLDASGCEMEVLQNARDIHDARDSTLDQEHQGVGIKEQKKARKKGHKGGQKVKVSNMS